jgi:hypothetical protein
MDDDMVESQLYENNIKQSINRLLDGFNVSLVTFGSPKLSKFIFFGLSRDIDWINVETAPDPTQGSGKHPARRRLSIKQYKIRFEIFDNMILDLRRFSLP